MSSHTLFLKYTSIILWLSIYVMYTHKYILCCVETKINLDIILLLCSTEKNGTLVNRWWHFWWTMPFRVTDTITFMVHISFLFNLWCKSVCLVRGIWSNNPALEHFIPSEPSDGALQKECLLEALCLVKSSQIWALQQTASVQNASYFLPIICGQFWIRKRSTHGASQTGWTPRSFTLPQIKLDQPLQK